MDGTAEAVGAKVLSIVEHKNRVVGQTMKLGQLLYEGTETAALENLI